jgi:hypothetical protein
MRRAQSGFKTGGVNDQDGFGSRRCDSAGAIVIFLGVSLTVEAGTVAPKGDRLDLTLRMASYLQPDWPYDQACAKHSGRPVRLVTTDRF